MRATCFFHVMQIMQNADMGVPVSITVPLSLETKQLIEAIAKSHPVATKASIARHALEIGLREVAKSYPPHLGVDMRLKRNREAVR